MCILYHEIMKNLLNCRFSAMSLPPCGNTASLLVTYSYTDDGAEAQLWQRQGLGVEHTCRLC